LTRFSPYNQFSRKEWARLRADTPLTLSEAELTQLRGQNEQVSLSEVADIYLPLTRLLNLYVAAAQDLYRASANFLNHEAARVPYIIGVAGSVAVGKSTTSRILQALLSRWPHHPKVDLVPTDGFLFNNRRLDELGLMRRKGFPESYDLQRLIRFVSDVKAGRRNVRIPVYSHETYDIQPGNYKVIDQPDLMIVEGLNVLQTGVDHRGWPYRAFISDYFDFTIYVHAETEVIRRWYVERFLTFRQMALRDPGMFFHRFASLSEEGAREHAVHIWSDINEVNLNQNILPARERAQLILNKGEDHSVQSVLLRKI
jgi:type I pantothenate kinase